MDLTEVRRLRAAEQIAAGRARRPPGRLAASVTRERYRDAMIRAYVADDTLTYNGVVVLFTIEAEGQPREIARFADGSFTGWETPEPHAGVTPSLRLNDDFARAMLDALTRHFHGAEDSRALRRDYDAERSRADLLIGHLGAIARQLAVPARGSA